MKIWVDADACPNAVKEILFRASERLGVQVTLVANGPVSTPPSPLVRSVRVSAGFDVADNEILKRLAAGDLVITADIPLAADVIERGGQALNPRGELYNKDTIRERLTMRDLMDTLRGSGINTGGPPAFGPRDRQTFANALDGILAKSKPRSA